MLMPKKVKHRKQQKGQQRGCSKAGNYVEFGEFGMQAMSRGRMTDKQIEACRVAINRSLKKKGKIWVRIFPDKPVTKKPAETRMGSGKGALDRWEAVIRPGKLLFEINNVTRKEAQDALRSAAAKINIKTRFVERLEMV